MINVEFNIYNEKGVNLTNHSIYDEEDNIPVLLEAYLRKFILDKELEKETLTLEITESDENGEYITTDNYSVTMKSPRNIEIDLI